MTGKGSIERRLRLKSNSYQKIALLNFFSLEQTHSRKNQKNKQKTKKTKNKKNHKSSQWKKRKKKNLPAGNSQRTNYYANMKSFRRCVEICSLTTYVLYNTYRSIWNRQLFFVTHLELMTFIPYCLNHLPARKYFWYYLGCWVLKQNHFPKIKKTLGIWATNSMK